MEQLLDKIAKAPAAAKWGAVGGGVVLLTILNFFMVIQTLDADIADRYFGKSVAPPLHVA